MADKYPTKEKILLKNEKKYEKELIKAYSDAQRSVKEQLSKLEEKGFLTKVEIFRYNRLISFYNDIGAILKELSIATNSIITKSLLDSYKVSNSYEKYIIETELQSLTRMAILNTKAIAEGIKTDLDAVGFIQRNKDNINNLGKQINQTLVQKIAQGLSYSKVANEINTKFNSGAYNALRLVRTESHRVQEKASMDASFEAQAAGVNIKKMWRASLDDRTRESHGNADSQIKDLDKPFEVQGELLMYPGDPAGSASNVIFCRCYKRSIVYGFLPNTRRIKGEGIKPNISYNEWIKLKT